jgi:hypothetical protein
MEYTELYKNWVKYLVSKKLYNKWMQDIKMIVDYGNTFSWIYNSFISEGKKRKLVIEKGSSIINSFVGCENEMSFNIQIHNIMYYKRNLANYGYNPSNVVWYTIWDEFYKKLHPPILSTKLSRRINRANNKPRSSKYREKVEQPWYDKSYEKYNRKAWRK